MSSSGNPEEVNQDELILQQQRRIEKEICDAIPLVSGLTTMAALDTEYLDDTVYLSKLADISKRYKAMRRTRPDGNCFFRAFAYAYMEYLVYHPEEYDAFRTLVHQSKEKLIELGFPKFTLEDFYESFLELVQNVAPSEGDLEKVLWRLHDSFNEQGLSDYVVVYLRLITSGQLQECSHFYADFIEGSSTMEEFRRQEVEPMYKESDHIHIIALSSALNVGVRVEYMDRSEGASRAHDFPEDVVPKVFLLYRPGHYDILYPQ